MIFYDLDKESIIENSKVVDDYYVYSLGNKIEVTALKKKHINTILSKNLSSEIKEDKMMIRYYPTNEIYFDRNFIDSINSKNFSSCLVSSKSYSPFVGNPEKYSIKSGILVLSGVLSLNNMIDKDRIIRCNSQMDDYARSKIKILACGVRDGKLLALFYVPNERGLAVSSNTGNLSISAKSLVLKNYDSWNAFTINDWFDDVKIKEL